MHYLSLLAFAAIYGAVTVAWGLPQVVGAAYLCASLACFIMYAIDKAAARSGQRRTPERTLLLLGLACGWPGAVLAQQWLRHKSAKPAFLTKFWALVLMNLIAFVVLASWFR
jgi:uncharacterized membrane protein YsdA (DUF1294 family)